MAKEDPRAPNPRLYDRRAMSFVMLKALIADAGLDRVKQLAFLPVAACLFSEFSVAFGFPSAVNVPRRLLGHLEL